MLVIADGATSKLAMQMGYCTEPPKGVCSRAFIEGGTHNVDFDGELFCRLTLRVNADLWQRAPAALRGLGNFWLCHGQLSLSNSNSMLI